MKRTTLLIIAILLSCGLYGKVLSERVESSIDSMMESGLNAKYYPGASVAIGNKNALLYHKNFGYQDDSKKVKVTSDDIYDIASVTKVVSTTFVLMKLYDEGKIDLNATVKDYLDCYGDTPVCKTTITQLLTHTSGLPYFPAYSVMFVNPTGKSLISTRKHNELYPQQVDRAAYICANPQPVQDLVSFSNTYGFRKAGEGVYVNPAIDTVVISTIANSYNPTLRGKYRYSDTNFYILRQIVESITGEELDVTASALFDKLEMYNTGYKPLEWKVPEMIIPTEYDHLLQRGLVRGYPHDDLAASSGGVEGNAGLFSNAVDLAHFCEMMLNNGVFRGERILSKATIELFTSTPLQPKGIYRGLGFDKRKPDSSLGNGYGHTGYTGTMIWIDPESDTYMVFLSNRVNPSRLSTGLSSSGLRTKIWELLTK